MSTSITGFGQRPLKLNFSRWGKTGVVMLKIVNTVEDNSKPLRLEDMLLGKCLVSKELEGLSLILI